jgi:DNA-binding transcriptional regulator YiaG
MDRLQEIATALLLARTGQAQQIRKRHQLSRREMAAQVGVSHAQLGRWETGQSRPRGDAAIRWLRVLRRLEKVG